MAAVAGALAPAHRRRRPARAPFPLSLLRGYGVVHIESAGENSRAIISSGLCDLKMTGATTFYRELTDAMTPH